MSKRKADVPMKFGKPVRFPREGELLKLLLEERGIEKTELARMVAAASGRKTGFTSVDHWVNGVSFIPANQRYVETLLRLGDGYFSKDAPAAPPKAVGPFSEAVEEYLSGPFGQGVSGETSARLRAFDFSLLGHTRVTVIDVHRIREAIDSALASRHPIEDVDPPKRR